MKLYIVALVAIASLVSTASAATGSTSTGSTSTGSTSTGTTLSGSTSTGTSTYTAPVVGGGGITKSWNYTKNSFDMVPQCFPWAWLNDFYKGNIFMIYENQKVCREQRAVDFRF